VEKVLLKIAGIVAIIVGIGWCFTIIGIIIGIFLIVGGSTIMGYSNLPDDEVVSKKSSILGWSIFFLFFTVIGGILGILFYLTMDSKIFVSKNVGKNDYIDEIKKLDELRKQGIKSDAKYEAKKKKIVDL
jgi:MFS family permease